MKTLMPFCVRTATTLMLVANFPFAAAADYKPLPVGR